MLLGGSCALWLSRLQEQEQKVSIVGYVGECRQK